MVHIYDGLLTAYSIVFAPGIRRSLNDSYKEAKEGASVITSLPTAPVEGDLRQFV